jgi:hypothetical protein
MSRETVFSRMRACRSGAARWVPRRGTERRPSEPFHDLRAVAGLRRAVAGLRPSHLTDRRSPRVPPVASVSRSHPTETFGRRPGRGQRPAPSAAALWPVSDRATSRTGGLSACRPVARRVPITKRRPSVAGRAGSETRAQRSRAVAGLRPSHLADRRSPRVPPVSPRVLIAPNGDLRSQAGRGRRPAPSAAALWPVSDRATSRTAGLPACRPVARRVPIAPSGDLQPQAGRCR